MINCCIWPLAALTAIATTQELPFREAGELLEAGLHEKAAEHYADLAQKESEPWRRTIAIINRGRALLLLKSWDQALSILNSVLHNYPTLPPLLLREALFLQAWALADSANSMRGGDFLALENSYRMQRMALKSAERAIKADCQLQFDKGARHCKPNGRLVALNTWVRLGLAQISADLSQAFITPKDLMEGLWHLQLSLLSVEEKILLWKQLGEDGIERFQQLSLSPNELENGLILAHVVDDMTHLTGNITSSYELMKGGFEKRDLTATSDALKEVKEKVNIPFQESELIARMNRTLQSYQTSKHQLSLLIEGAERVLKKEILDEQKVGPLLKNALKEVEQGRDLSAKLMIGEAKQRLIAALSIDDKNPETALKMAIEQQKYTAQITLMLSAEEANLIDDVKNFLIESEKTAENYGILFVKAVAKRQQIDFYGIPPRCQKHPWDSVLPLFHSGMAAARAATAGFKSDALHLDEIWKTLKNGISLWEQALQKLQEPLKEEQEDCYQQKSPKGQDNIADIMRRAQSMLKEDLIKTKPKSQPRQEKPW